VDSEDCFLTLGMGCFFNDVLCNRPIIIYNSNSLFREGIENLRQLNFKKSGGNK
jgi:hypothetical protein